MICIAIDVLDAGVWTATTRDYWRHCMFVQFVDYGHAFLFIFK
jgi:hypothetical protein